MTRRALAIRRRYAPGKPNDAVQRDMTRRALTIRRRYAPGKPNDAVQRDMTQHPPAHCRDDVPLDES
ncbi:hypothetical protein [Nocardia ninae]|uniref:hypothetical protein n=1 Tax=Nocardia ninae TaxID=356145 RepID=UPI0011BDB873|nr:hypothetical protein [Nocardia ninae]